MLKTSLVILYSVPLALIMFWSYKYSSASELTAFYKEAETQLAVKTSDFADRIARLKPAKEDIEQAEQAYFDYRKVSNLCHTSWSSLLNRLESLTPGQVRFRRIGIKPDKLVRISLEGEAAQLSYLTDFLRSLYAEKIFMNPNLKKHHRVNTDGSSAIGFSLEVDYAGEAGELP